MSAKTKSKSKPVSLSLEDKIRQAQGAPSPESWDFDNVATLQEAISNGTVWSLEGSVGRSAMQALESGACFLPEESFADYWGNTVPSRNSLKEGTKGTLSNSANFYNI